ncbi:MAG TPA: DUF5915 domain-containing protein, partial [Chloroflexota bacterium]|nr:DUF5915 domain-containing protein [Chloroflexota bacterium]
NEKVNDEFGRPMHKSTGNSIPFDVAAEKMGADVLRWIYCAANPELNLNFGYGLADETRRKLLTLWNVHSFFVTYANIDGFDPTARAVPVADRPVLDRWILARLQEVTESVDRAIGGYNPSDAPRRLEEFFDDLSNWYLRRSRRRFWKTEADADKIAAYATLYETLVQLAKLMAPIVPFLAEELYQNLVRSVDSAALFSVHHHEYPRVSPELVDEGLLRDVELLRAIVELGRAARNKAALKVRQPLAEVLVKLANQKERTAVEKLAGQIQDELNVKAVRFVDNLGDLVTYSVKGKPQILGPKYGREAPGLLAVIRAADAAEIARAVRAGETFVVNGVQLTSEDVDVSTSDRPGLSVAADNQLAVGISTALTPELRQEGLARELVHRIQTMRKAADFQIEDRISTYFEAPEEVGEVVERFAPYIKGETLSRSLVPGPGPAKAYRETATVDGFEVTLAVIR